MGIAPLSFGKFGANLATENRRSNDLPFASLGTSVTAFSASAPVTKGRHDAVNWAFLCVAFALIHQSRTWHTFIGGEYSDGSVSLLASSTAGFGASSPVRPLRYCAVGRAVLGVAVARAGGRWARHATVFCRASDLTSLGLGTIAAGLVTSAPFAEFPHQAIDGTFFMYTILLFG